MTVTLKKVNTGKYEVKANKVGVGFAFVNGSGLYIIELPNRTTIKAINQTVLKSMVAKEMAI